MNYKISTYVLLAALAGTVFYFKTGEQKQEPLYFKFSSDNKDGGADSVQVTRETLDMLEDELSVFTDTLHYDNQEVIEEWKAAQIDPMDGSPYSPSEAGQRMKAFTDWNGRRWNFVRSITPYGFAFGKDRLQLMLDEINKINSGISIPENKITGVRIHFSIANPDRRARRGNMDVMLIPVKRDGKSYFDFKPGATTAASRVASNAIIDTSSPCPTLCN